MGVVTFLQCQILQNLNMKIYKDVFSGDELFSDTYPMKLVDNCMYEVYGKHITRAADDIQLAGSNASAEEAAEGDESSSQSGVDLVLNHRLVETGFGSKKDYTIYLKDYMKKVIKHLEDNGRTAEVDEFKELQFFTGESMDAEAMILIMDYREHEGEERPVVLAFKHGLDEEKV